MLDWRYGQLGDCLTCPLPISFSSLTLPQYPIFSKRLAATDSLVHREPLAVRKRHWAILEIFVVVQWWIRERTTDQNIASQREICRAKWGSADFINTLHSTNVWKWNEGWTESHFDRSFWMRWTCLWQSLTETRKVFNVLSTCVYGSIHSSTPCALCNLSSSSSSGSRPVPFLS